MEGYLLVITTTDSKEVAVKISEGVVEKGLAACVQIIDRIHSVYKWQGKVEESEEFLLFLKTKSEAYSQLEALIKRMHNYSVPEIIAIPIVKGYKDYLAWIDEVINIL